MTGFTGEKTGLKFQLTCRHCESSTTLRAYATKKAERLGKRFDGIHRLEMILSIEGGTPKAELVLGAVRGITCVAAATHDDMLAAIDLVVDKIDRQVTKLKGKLRGHHGKAPESPTAQEE